MGYALKDAQKSVTRALPNGAAAVNSTGIDLEHGSRGDVVQNMELRIEAPAVSVTQLPDTQTLKYDVECADDSGFATNLTVLAKEAVVQTGAGGAGAAAQNVNFRLGVDCRRFVRVKVTKSGAGDATAATATISLVF